MFSAEMPDLAERVLPRGVQRVSRLSRVTRAGAEGDARHGDGDGAAVGMERAAPAR